jgi:hypothetical protein
MTVQRPIHLYGQGPTNEFELLRRVKLGDLPTFLEICRPATFHASGFTEHAFMTCQQIMLPEARQDVICSLGASGTYLQTLESARSTERHSTPHPCQAGFESAVDDALQ